MMKNDNRCPYCGGLFDISPKHDGIEKWKCRSCGYVVYIDSEDDKRQMYEMGECVDSIIGHVNGRRSRKMSDKKQEWQEWAAKDKIDACISKYAGKLLEDPLFAMVQVANLTYGFQTYESEGAESTKDNAEGLYEIASAYLKKHKEASKLKELAYLYKKKLRNKSSKRATKFWLSFVSVIAVCAAVFVAGMWIYAPSVNDANSGVNISIPNDAISIFQKLNVNADVEKQPQNSVSYIDAKNALRNETEKFDLYDISLKSGSSTLNFDGSVTVSMPIPKGYDTSAIKVFYVSSDETYEEIPSTVSVANNTVTFTTTHFSLYAIAERHPIVIFDTAGGDEVDRQIVKRDDLATAPADPKRNGYTFAGWTLDGQKWDFARDTVKKDITLVALWIPNKYTVTFDTNGGIGTANERDIAYMTTYGSLPTLIKPGYTFVGWYTAAEYGTQVTAETVMDKLSAHTLYARFTINTNKIIFNANGGSGVMNDFSLKSGETARLPQCTYKRTGFKFIGWSTTMTGDVVYTDKAQYTMGTAESYVLYAQWEICTGVVKFNANGGEGTMSPVSMNYSQAKPLDANTFTRTGYDFIGWSTEPTGSIVYADRAIYTMGEKSEYTLYAQWKKKTNKLYFNPNGGIGNMHYIEIEYNAKETLPLNQFEREGYTFIGWSLDPLGTKEYDNGAEFKMGANDEYTLYAMWAGQNNRFTFDANGGSGAMQTDFTIATGEESALPINLFTRVGYKFIGWSTEKGGSIRYKDGDTYKKLLGGDVTLYANWEAVEYTLTFESNGGSATDEKKYNITSGNVVLPTPTKTGYVFDGWFDNENFTGNAVTAVYTGSYGNRTFYANWHADTYTIEFDTQCGIAVENKEYTIETDTFGLPTPTRDGYTFAGWYTSEDLSGEPVASIEKGSIGNKKYYAAWSEVTYTIQFNSNGGSECGVINYQITTPTFELANKVTVTRAHYIFDGWYENADFSGERVSAVQIGTFKNITLYAKWIPVNYSIIYNVNGGEVVENGNYNTEQEVTLPTTVKTGYNFGGWYEKADFSGECVENIPEGSFGAKTFYAKWIPVEYTVNFSTDGGSAIDDIKYTIEDAVIWFSEVVNTTKDGYVFAGWYTTPEFDGEAVTHVAGGMHEHINLYAKWDIDTFDIVYAGSDGYTLLAPTYNYTIKSDEIVLVTPSKKGYEFIGWFDNDEFEGEAIATIPTGSFGDKCFYPKWEIITYTIEFVSNGGDAVQKITYTVNDGTITLPTTARAHYDFAGWCTSDTLATYITEVQGRNCRDYKFYAKWTPVEYEITYDYRDNGEHSFTENDNYNIESAFNLKTPEREGYTFAGWYANKDLSGEPIANIEKGTTGNKTFYAKWSANQYAIEFESNGGSDIDKQNYNIESENITLPTPTKTGYIFDGWFDNEDFTGNPVTTVYTGSIGNKTFYAKWHIDTYTVEFDTGCDVVVDGKEYTVETDTFTLPVPTRNGYTFEGWYANEDFSGNAVTSIVTGTTGNKTFYAKWECITYKITFVTGGGTAVTEIEFTVEDAFTLPETGKTYYTFDGWYENADFTGDSVTDVMLGTYRDITLYAKLTPVEYEIIYHTDIVPNGSYNVETDTFNLPIPVWNGREFLGWYEKPDFSGNAVEEIQKGSNGKKEYYPKWSAPIVYTITFESNDGTSVSDMTYTAEDAFALPEPTKDRYIFGGWYENADFSDTATRAIVEGSYGNKNYYAKWIPMDYTVSYNYTNPNGHVSKLTDASFEEGDLPVAPGSVLGFVYSFEGFDVTYQFTVGAEFASVGSDGTIAINSNATKNSLITVQISIDGIVSTSVKLKVLPEGKYVYAGGYGTTERPYLITTESHLNAMASNKDKSFLLLNDIGGTKDNMMTWSGIEGFSGVFDGGGHTIYNVELEHKSTHNGFFTTLTGGTVRNVKFDNVKFYVSDYWPVGQTHRFGIIAGETDSNSLIENCFVTNSEIHVRYNHANHLYISVGGIAGYSHSTIKNCMVTATSLYNEARGNASRNDCFAYVGGIAGTASTSSAVIDGCVSYGNTLKAHIYTNGYKKEGNPANAYFYMGGIVGKSQDGPTVKNSQYYNNSISKTRDFYDHYGWNDTDYNPTYEYNNPCIGHNDGKTILSNNTEKLYYTTEYNGHRYALIGEVMLWDDAADKCEELGGHLVTITSAEENAIVYELAKVGGKNVWIGGTDVQSEGNFVWVTGETFDYTNWNTGEPSNNNGDGHYMQLYVNYGSGNSYWDDCGITQLFYVCEWDELEIIY